MKQEGDKFINETRREGGIGTQMVKIQNKTK
jgi:hypothetical protein